MRSYLHEKPGIFRNIRSCDRKLQFSHENPDISNENQFLCQKPDITHLYYNRLSHISMENSLMNSLDDADLFHYIRQIDIFPWLKKFSKTVEFPNLDIAYTAFV